MNVQESYSRALEQGPLQRSEGAESNTCTTGRRRTDGRMAPVNSTFLQWESGGGEITMTRKIILPKVRRIKFRISWPPLCRPIPAYSLPDVGKCKSSQHLCLTDTIISVTKTAL